MNELLHNAMIQAYLNSVCEQVRCREVHAEIRDELLSHIADRMEGLLESGISEAQAAEQALRQMGDADVVGRQLHQLHRPRLDWWLLAAVAALVLVGLWAMYAVDISGSFQARYMGMMQGQVRWALIGLGVGATLALFDYRRLQRFSWPMLGATMLVAITIALMDPHDDGRPLLFDLSPLFYVPALAGIFANWDWGAPKSVWNAVALIAVPPMIYLKTGWMFPMLQYAVLSGMLLLASRPRRSQVMLLAGAGGAFAAVLAYYLVSTPYRVQRLLVLLNPYRDPESAGYQIIQARAAVGNAGLWGRGPLTRIETLPLPHNEFVFPYLVYTLGWLAGAAICLLAVLFTIRLLRAGRGVRDPFGHFLIHGIATLFMLQFGWNLLMIMGVLPMASVDLPFISGGSHQVLYMALVGLALSVFRRKTTTAKI